MWNTTGAKKILAGTLIAGGVTFSGAALAHAANEAENADAGTTFTAPAKERTTLLPKAPRGAEANGENAGDQGLGKQTFLADAATKLGVSEDALTQALAAVKDKPRDERQAALAEALGVTTEQLAEAIPAPHRGPKLDTAALAQSLGISEEQVRTTLDQFKPTTPPKGDAPQDAPQGAPEGAPAEPAEGEAPAPREHAKPNNDELVAALAELSGTSEDKVRAALEAAMPKGRDGALAGKKGERSAAPQGERNNETRPNNEARPNTDARPNNEARAGAAKQDAAQDDSGFGALSS